MVPSKSLSILKHHPHLSALVVDRAQVIVEAKQYWTRHDTSGVERLQFESGDLLGTIPPTQNEKDIYFLSAVLHGFDDETCVAGLRNLADACRCTGARIALLEIVLPELHADLVGASFDMQMFMGSRGRERTLREWTELFNRSGLVLEELVGLQSFGNILVLRANKS